MRDGWRLAVGTLTALPVRAPARVDGTTARWSVLLAPVAVLPLGAAVALLGMAGRALDVPTLAVGLLAVAILALGTRALHWDGLSDTADGLTASYDRERSLEVMRSGTSGPAGVLATVLAVGLQVVGLAALLATTWGAVTAALAVCASRASLTLTCRRGVPAARPGGLGSPLAGVVSSWAPVLSWFLLALCLTGVGLAAGHAWWRAPLAVALTVAVVLLLVRRVVRRLGGVTGDVFGAAIEGSLAVLLVALA